MADLQGLINFPGISFPQRCVYTASLGTLPGVAVLECRPQANPFPSVGNLSWSYGNVGWTMSGCLVDSAFMRGGAPYHVMQLMIHDRRWAWQNREISGAYNIRRRSGEFVPSTVRTPQQLAQILFTALGEPFANVGQLPNASRPEVDWQCADPAYELTKLCRKLGCVPGYDPITDTVGIVRLGVGNPLPTGGDVQTGGFGVNPPQIGAVKVCGGEIIVQSKLKLEAVALETDLSYVPVNQVSYLPVFGWENESDTEQFYGVNGDQERELAVASVWRSYRVVSQADGSQSVPMYQGVIESIDQILPLRSYLVETYTVQNEQYHKRPFIEGVYVPGGGVENLDNMTGVVETPFRLDAERGIVHFSQPVYRRDDDQILPAELYLTCAYGVRNAATYQQERYHKTRTIGPGPGPQVTIQDDLLRTIRGVYAGTNLISVADNLSVVNAEADKTLDGMQSAIRTSQSSTVRYRGLQPISLDGQRHQVRWEVSMSSPGAFTVAGWQQEFDRIPRRKERERRTAADAASRQPFTASELRRLRRQGVIS